MKLTKLLEVIEVLASSNNISKPLLCGGLVRDKILGLNNNLNDIDITTGSEDIHKLAKLSVNLFTKLGANSSIAKDGHTSIYFSNIKLDFSSHFIIKNYNFNTDVSLIKEMKSRDFTCNALLCDFSFNKFYDPLGTGYTDIEKKIIRTCLEPEITLSNDPKRIIRVLYLSSKLNFKINDDIKDFIKNNGILLNNVEPKYIKKNLLKSMQYNKENTINLINELNLKQYLEYI